MQREKMSAASVYMVEDVTLRAAELVTRCKIQGLMFDVSPLTLHLRQAKIEAELGTRLLRSLGGGKCFAKLGGTSGW